MILYNPKDENVEFSYGGIRIYFKSKESKTFPEHVAIHALERARVGLVEYNPSYDKEMTATDMSYPEMPWRKLVSLASARGIFKPGTKRPVLEKDLEDYDTQGRTL